MKNPKEPPTKIDELLSIVDTSSLTKPELKDLKQYLTIESQFVTSKPISKNELYRMIGIYADKIGKQDLKIKEKIKELNQKELNLEIDQQELDRIIKTKVLEKNNTASARNKSQDQIKADKQFDQLYKPERLKKGSTINRTTNQTLNAWAKVNLKIVERHNIDYYNGLGLRGKQVEKWICLFNNNYDRKKTAIELGIEEDSLRKSMPKLIEAMHEIFIKTFDEEFNENPILKADVIEYFSSQLNSFYK